MDQKDKKKSVLHEYIRYTGVGFEVITYIMIFVAGGYFLDIWLETNPWFTLSLSLLGCGVAMYVIIKKLGNIK